MFQMDFQGISRIASIIVKEVTGGINVQERIILDRWLGRSAANREMYRRLKSGESVRWHLDNFHHLSDPDTVAQVKRRIRGRIIRHRMVRFAVAAVVVGCVLSSVLLLPTDAPINRPTADGMGLGVVISFNGERQFVLSDPARETEWQNYLDDVGSEECVGDSISTVVCRVEIPKGFHQKLRLDDGTVVWLNAETTFEYPAKFTGDIREVKLTGEAFFEVVSKESNPFVVITPDGVSLKVTGTKFNMETYSGCTDVRITLVEGAVSVAADCGQLDLQPYEQVVIDRQAQTMKLRKVENMEPWIGWVDGLFFVEDAPLAEIFAKMERWYGISVIYDSKADIYSLGTFTVKSSNRDNFASVLNALQEVTGLEYTVKENNIFIGLPL